MTGRRKKTQPVPDEPPYYTVRASIELLEYGQMIENREATLGFAGNKDEAVKKFKEIFNATWCFPKPAPVAEEQLQLL